MHSWRRGCRPRPIKKSGDTIDAWQWVADRGVGIDDAYKTKVFDRFFRIDDPKIKSFPGMGLGLYISAAIIRRHNGTIGLKSKKGKGSVFHFTLPYMQDDYGG